MQLTLAAVSATGQRAQTHFAELRSGERVAVLFFVYLTVLAWVRHLGMAEKIVLPALALLICRAGRAESSRSTPVTRVVRDWLSMVLILAAYWSVGWFTAPPLVAWQEHWLGWDRVLLTDWGLRAAIESAGIFLPSVLEVVYLLLYAIPPACVCVLYRIGGREKINAFLHMLLLGTLSAYALLALLPVHGPHVVYPGADLSHIQGFGRTVNVWVLDHMDIATSVFPSGHVAVAFSCAFGMYGAVPKRPAVWGTVFAVATMVYVATIFCRYHYAVDGLASIFLVAAVYAARRRGGLD